MGYIAKGVVKGGGDKDLGTSLGERLFQHYSKTTITAGTTQTQAGATQLVGDFNAVTTVATALDGVKLPTAKPGIRVAVRNAGASVLRIWPFSGDTINGQAADLSVDIGIGSAVAFQTYNTADWHVSAGNLLASPRCVHTGGTSPQTTTTGTSKTAAASTKTYVAELVNPVTTLVTGIAIFNAATVGTDKYMAYITDAAGVVVATTALAGVTTSGAAAHQLIPLTAVKTLVPGTYFICLQVNGTTDTFRAHAAGSFATIEISSTVFGTAGAITPPTTFVAGVGPIASLY